MADIYSKYSYEKKWTKTSLKDLERILSEEMPEAPLADTLKYVLDTCKKGQTVSFMEIAFKEQS